MTNTSSTYSRLNTQEVICTLEGKIIEFNNNFFNFKKGHNIFNAHPFFESISTLVIETQDLSSSYPCVHIDYNDLHLICDISVKREDNQLIFVILDYTVPYKELNAISQQRNESIIAAEILALKNNQLEQQKEFKNKFLANISHEIRTPLNAIVGFTEVLKKTKLSLEQTELTNVITDAGEQLTAIIDDMLDIAQIEMGELNIKQEEFNLEEVITNLAKVYAKKAEDKGLLFYLNYDNSIYSSIVGDKLRVQQIVGNLLQNAIKYTTLGSVEITVKKSFQQANKIGIDLSIKDTGLGIAQEKLPHIFDSFYQVTPTQKNEGTGLGLSITKNIIERIGGKIHVDSLLNKGSEFKVYLPFKLNLKTSTKAVVHNSKKKSPFVPGEKHNLLLVENSELNQLLVIKTLLNHGGFYVDVANNGEKALQYIQLRDYDVILMDLKMPVLDGFETTKAIRKLKDRALKKIPIIALTGLATAEQEKACMAIGMNAYLTKPFKQQELIEVLEDVFRKIKK